MAYPAPGPHPDSVPAPGPRHRRPAPLDPSSMDAFAVHELDPAVITQVAHETAAAIVRTGRGAHDPALTARLVGLVEEIGLMTLAELWSHCPARSLPGVLWRLYVLREWVRRDPPGASADYAAGVRFAGVSDVVAGPASPPGPEELRDLADAILRGVFEGDLGVALHRAAAFCRVVSAGRACRDPEPDAAAPSTLTARASPAHPVSGPSGSFGGSDHQARQAALVLTMGDDLEAAAGLWRRGGLD
ncbi:MAG TPA: hypothetical protein VES01_10085 [Dermatophilaceae bacterium]|nr:hypothetical protein [Dermatophilaceae bacterium]